MTGRDLLKLAISLNIPNKDICTALGIHINTLNRIVSYPYDLDNDTAIEVLRAIWQIHNLRDRSIKKFLSDYGLPEHLMED